jgi:feruloyl esterase
MTDQKQFRVIGFAAAAMVLLLAFHSTATAAVTCESLSSLKLTGATVTAVELVAAGKFTPPAAPARGGGGGRGGAAAGGRGAAAAGDGAAPAAAGGGRGARYDDLPAFCRVQVNAKPSSDSDIKIEVWLPEAGWNGKFEAAGNGAWAGSFDAILLASMTDALRHGYATAGTDTGHQGGNGSFALGHPEKLIDFSYRAIHEMTEKAKSVISAYYGNAPRLSYFNSCSSGGKQGSKEAQMYPADYDGIIAGSATSNWTGRAAQSVWVAQAVHLTDASYIPTDKYALIHNAVLQACDTLDGVKDGVLENPRLCKFDPKVLECKAGDSAACLTTPQVEAARKIYAPVINLRTKQVISPGLEPGSELGWNTMAAQQPLDLGLDHFRYVVFNDPNWDYKTFNFDSDLALTAKMESVVNATDPNLKPFFDRGGKLIQYHGWNDPRSIPGNSVNYYESVVDKIGSSSKVRDSYRLFMVPGMGHCQGGEGTDTFDKLSALEQWVEKGKAPDQIIASHSTGGKVDKTRPLCPYPQSAAYKGSGDTNDAANFVCK